MELLLIENEHKFHYLFIKEINEFMYNKTKHNDKKHCLEISGKQVVNMLKKSSNLQFNNYRKQLQASFMIYAEFESNLKEVQKI